MASIETQRQNIEVAEKHLATLKDQLAETEALRETDPITFLAVLVYENRQKSGTYGYEYGTFGESERKRAEKVLVLVKDDVDVAAAVITELDIR